MEADSFQSLVCTISRLIEARKDDRATAYKKGFQRTPAFILAVIKDALTQIRSPGSTPQSMPQGGFTDVGQHTGGVPRPTSWALVQQTVQVSPSDN